MTLDRLRAICKALPGATADVQWATTSSITSPTPARVALSNTTQSDR